MMGTKMGTKIRNFVPLPDLSLEELVPKDSPEGQLLPPPRRDPRPLVCEGFG
jgi:hypothetical protein